MNFEPWHSNLKFATCYCPGGEIGRHTSLRGWRPQGCASSNLVPGTFKCEIENAELENHLALFTAFFP